LAAGANEAHIRSDLPRASNQASHPEDKPMSLILKAHWNYDLSNRHRREEGSGLCRLPSVTSASNYTMKYLIVLLLPLAVALTAFASDKAGDFKDIQGTWLPTKAEIGGKSMGNDFIASTTLTLADGKYEVFAAGTPDKGAYAIDPALKPKSMDITGTEGPNAGKKIPAIYELRGDTLRICYGLGGRARPTEFKSPPGTQDFLVIYMRKKAK
jgi:uncharacterized protein (TIGR03067 family)